ncbi:Sir2 family NAD-dependent protein deacetylase [Lactobacillus mulieris]|uniref:Sir2 family NAD-dependent protein deacetylase n=1 Tax=Lactobacillus mulieris TaxID=2508708 RepID=A0AAW5WXZ3_9LACO|nr:Sir2 family NAD-dependent protein deacetylase [Lactobacillus mulieris]MCZ3621757.1 Sir2 family NAD-dependent protein deacetylase [Lactobacillus mulieris]MCZ3623454.1 Sir2 family NAD-dependent protein deacetylase [Lactobacillus mulieris]MCZ3635764.1 Sir2 family NAD-dependent protein deacetylase [Lactobacillus mulieris]MCZ3690520.1 Sir2 family NAD-dependent protein deacetylase [Lactobacillus mulieris]MCZ3696446.1 Sir2 family NAD-dependent protein deacetylase [Lactobacillus mulieris]
MADFEKARKIINEADAILITAGNGFASLDGFDMLDEASFKIQYPDLVEKYNFKTIGDALDKRLSNWDEQWSIWRRFIDNYSINYQASSMMQNLKTLLKGKEYFIATSYYIHAFENAGFDSKKIFNIFGDWTTMACSSGINHGLKSDLQIYGVPKCEICNSEMEIHMPLTAHFYPDTDANTRLRIFITNNESRKVAVLGLGVDELSPQLLEPITHLVSQFESWHYISADLCITDLPQDVAKRSIAAESNSESLLEGLIS